MSDEERDPEVIADMQLRAYSQHDRSRSGTPDFEWKAPEVIGKWKCRWQCGRYVDVTQDTMEALAVWNRRLVQQGEEPLDIHTVLRCMPCTLELKKRDADQLRRRVERTADVIKQLKGGSSHIRFKTKDGDHAVTAEKAFEFLKKWGHPDVEGLKQCLSEKTSTNKKPNRGGM